MISPGGGNPSQSTALPPIVCLSHLAWDAGLFQRPQQIMSRLAQLGHAVYYFACVGHHRHKQAPHAGPVHGSPGVNVFTIPYAPGVRKLVGPRKWAAALKIARCLRRHRIRNPILWFYHPSLFALGYSHDDAAIVYDIMDHFPSFESTVADIYFDELMLLAEADVIFTGGRTLNRHAQQMLDVLQQESASKSARPATATPVCLPSGVDLEHFSKALEQDTVTKDQSPAAGPVFGYFGAIDERMDWEIIRHLAAHTNGRVVLAGPLLRQPPPDLPGNVSLPGAIPYTELPALLATFDVALIPFRNSPLVQYISPTKTPEYLAGGKPVVSTPIPDVIADYGKVVAIADSPENFTQACLELAATPPATNNLAEAAATRARTWDQIAQEMQSTVLAATTHNRESGSSAQ